MELCVKIAAATPDGGRSGDQEEGTVHMDSDNLQVEDGQKRSPGEVSGPEDSVKLKTMQEKGLTYSLYRKFNPVHCTQH
jgi:hypothetical protein